MLRFTSGAFPTAVSLLCALLRIEICPIPQARRVIHFYSLSTSVRQVEAGDLLAGDNVDV